MKYDKCFYVQLLDPVRKLDFITEQVHLLLDMLEDVSDQIHQDQSPDVRFTL